jgi:leishmanolysin-like peptidase
VKRRHYAIVSKRVVEEVRDHFNCSDLIGAELEDQGGFGTALVHWEKRLFENEAMTGTHTQHPIYSRITLALFEDSGWYDVLYQYVKLKTSTKQCFKRCGKFKIRPKFGMRLRKTDLR